MPPEYLFVYGTLMRGIQSSMSAFLSQNATYMEEAEYPGFLFDLGRYPGFVPDPAAGETVKGQLFALPAPALVLATLDHYEGLYETVPEYERNKLEFGPYEAWAYIFIGDPHSLVQIPKGQYADYYQYHSAHQHFIQSKP